jgi:hypothetical protein
MKKYAIAMLIFANEYYIPGTIISAYVHKKYITKFNLDIDLIVMVDDIIYKYKDELLIFFDQVKKINLLEMKLSDDYFVIKKYSKWMKYSINKWQILQYDNYDKILFLDADFLPLDDKFYEIFNFNTPAVTTNLPCDEGSELSKTFFMNVENVKEINNAPAESYYNIALKLQSSINATVIMLKPNIAMYEEYVNFLRKAEKRGYNSLTHSGIDETSLLLFLRYYKDIPIYCIPKKFSIAPWDDKNYDINNIYGLNYVSFIKPWLRLPMLQWPEENIWHIIAKKALKKSEKFTEIYVNGLMDNLDFFANNYKNFNKKSGYNLDVLQKQRNKIFPLINYVKKNKNLKYQKIQDIIKIKKIMDDSKYIHSFMNDKSIINYDKILELIDQM